MSIEEAFGVVIRDLRKQRGLTWIQLASEVGVSYQSIWEIESGRAGPRLKVVFKLAESLQVGADELMKRTSIVYRDQRVE